MKFWGRTPTQNWSDISNKPFNNPELVPGTNSGNKGILVGDSDGYGNPFVQFNRGKDGYAQTSFMYIDWAWQNNKDYDVRLAMDSNYFGLDFSNGGHKLFLTGLPSSPVGLANNSIWRDENGFLRIV